MRKLFVLLWLGFCSLAAADEAYICMVDKSTGFKLSSTGRWEEASFYPDESKYLLKKKGAGWEWSKFGDKFGMPCPAFNKHGLLNCDLLFGAVRVQRDTLRFIKTYTVGYIDGDQPGNTPSIGIGKCTPL